MNQSCMYTAGTFLRNEKPLVEPCFHHFYHQRTCYQSSVSFYYEIFCIFFFFFYGLSELELQLTIIFTIN